MPAIRQRQPQSSQGSASARPCQRWAGEVVWCLRASGQLSTEPFVVNSTVVVFSVQNILGHVLLTHRFNRSSTMRLWLSSIVWRLPVQLSSQAEEESWVTWFWRGREFYEGRFTKFYKASEETTLLLRGKGWGTRWMLLGGYMRREWREYWCEWRGDCLHETRLEESLFWAG